MCFDTFVGVSKLAIIGASSFSVEPAVCILNGIYIPEDAVLLYISHIQNRKVYQALHHDHRRFVRNNASLVGGAVYVAKGCDDPNEMDMLEKYISFKDNKFLLSDKDPIGRNPLIDAQMMSVAHVFRGRCIGGVLNGCGTDGSRGITAIHEAGGKTIVLDGEDYEHACNPPRTMPEHAVATGCVDYVLPLDEFRQKLEELLNS